MKSVALLSGVLTWTLLQDVTLPVSLPSSFDAEKLTLVAGLSWAILALMRGWVVPGSTHAALRADRDDWRARCDRLTAIAELALRSKVEKVA